MPEAKSAITGSRLTLKHLTTGNRLVATAVQHHPCLLWHHCGAQEWAQGCKESAAAVIGQKLRPFGILLVFETIQSATASLAWASCEMATFDDLNGHELQMFVTGYFVALPQRLLYQMAMSVFQSPCDAIA